MQMSYHRAFTRRPVPIRLFFTGRVLTWLAIQFYINRPTPPLAPVLASLPIHVYPDTVTSWSSLACDSAITAICISLSIRRFLTSCLFGYSPRTFICIRFISLISFSSLIQLSIFCCLLILLRRSCLECFCFQPRLSLEC